MQRFALELDDRVDRVADTLGRLQVAWTATLTAPALQVAGLTPQRCHQFVFVEQRGDRRVTVVLICLLRLTEGIPLVGVCMECSCGVVEGQVSFQTSGGEPVGDAMANRRNSRFANPQCRKTNGEHMARRPRVPIWKQIGRRENPSNRRCSRQSRGSCSWRPRKVCRFRWRGLASFEYRLPRCPGQHGHPQDLGNPALFHFEGVRQVRCRGVLRRSSASSRRPCPAF